MKYYITVTLIIFFLLEKYSYVERNVFAYLYFVKTAYNYGHCTQALEFPTLSWACELARACNAH